ncbi:heme NO-binding domain-containing protein [Rhodoferax mekongensis]|uniref:Heme NO-binding domain-containing protein n=1 Tax=Rhodoferax mekongensis TaxID=3068341 RepID=A0ABZ0B0X0_9BURK|nr:MULTISPECIES: heme NO-binding domain-containing protein [unclassified Rhodoferax]MDT7513665.1 heme NO-binding domain-containing protein [Rhodoferax sp. TBRC 17199]WNO05486.1 heme NO-binding domain-containing protein [Rhodoferax sp. TBRC 17307]
MKGMVFTEFLEMVEDKFSADMVDDIIDDSAPPSGGAYTAVGTYDHNELVGMVVALSQRSGLPVPALVHAFGVHLFGRFHALYPAFFGGITSAVDFLYGIESVIHTEVRKLYPDAQLPSFDCERLPDGLNMLYASPRHFGDLAEGLIAGAVAHFGDPVNVTRVNLPDGAIRFELRNKA